MIVRQANIEDSEKLVGLFKDFRAFYNAREKTDLEIKDFVEQRIFNNDSIILVIEFEGKIIAYAQLFPSFSTIELSPIWILNDLFVSKNYRRSGVAEKLLDKIIAYTIETGRKQIWLLTANDNLNAQNLYLKKEFVKTKFQHYAYKL